MRTRSIRLTALVWACGIALCAPAFADREPPELVAFEEATRAKTNWATRTRDDLGPDPFRLVPAPIPNRWVGLLRGAAAVVLLDEEAREIGRAAAPGSPTGLAWDKDGSLLVVGEATGRIARFRVEEAGILPVGNASVRGSSSLRDIAVLGDQVFVLDPIRHRVLAPTSGPNEQNAREIAVCEGPVQLRQIGPTIVANCLLEGALLVFTADGDVLARIEHDGPFWSIGGIASEGSVVIAAGGVENRPLDRSDGAFGYIDSFAFVYRIDLETRKVSPLAEVNISELGIVMPKWTELVRNDDSWTLRLVGHATPDLVSLTWPTAAFDGAPKVRRSSAPRGIADVSGGLGANPLLDSWVVLGEENAPARNVPVASSSAPQRRAESKIGEALFFTTLMAPWNGSEGARSRFTCETCHHEGYVDGRTHYTGRGNVHATTKPLVGLHGNRPYFSRALDPTMARMVHNEFRVANKKNGHDPWFPLQHEDIAWLGLGDAVPPVLSPMLLRRSLMTFLMGFEHTRNASTSMRRRFSPVERRGAEVFRDRCESCHSARLVSDDPASRVAFDDWEENVFTNGTIVWGRVGYEATGIEPFVHPEGARVPSLRRLYRKRPYFTNGSAADLTAVLSRITVDDEARQHAATEPRHPLPAEDQAALLAFLGLL